MSRTNFPAFADDSTVVNLAGDALTISNDPSRIRLSGELEIARDQEGLKRAQALLAALTSIVEALKAAPDLPAKLADEPPAPTGTIANPF
ncbi:hypothetical protein [Burkholderia plantarii]|uniref:Uncharacterized protein n=1 Tax=Burkholderia plantarii TaxID=41899 RepID=A0A0B6S2Q7_BURPL|nr:hypothetical protein [Burkholderia plantarii]AJK46521.1 hypothetical protein BGL_1c20120 [Burkholderia plantarii]ALK30655.1 hypothetical protein bpln_1g18640 [Burkholderia plantarii]WLE59382.1 hypothetical protein GIY62_01375 [Burkholderia plantarii]GLZ19267.1 hypothetical protein Bpla01_27970 [Burkholderia plantarii]